MKLRRNAIEKRRYSRTKKEVHDKGIFTKRVLFLCLFPFVETTFLQPRKELEK